VTATPYLPQQPDGSTYLRQVEQQRDQDRRDLRSAEDELARLRPLVGDLRRQLTRTELTLAAEEQTSIRELTAAVDTERKAARYRAAWLSARRHANEYRAALDTVLDQSEMAHLIAHTADKLDQAEAARDGAYRERAHLTAWLATIHPAVLAPAPDVNEPGWQILYLTAGGRQLSWHIHPRDADLYAHVEHVPADDPRAQWDGHTTEAKYAAIRQLCTKVVQEVPPCCVCGGPSDTPTQLRYENWRGQIFCWPCADCRCAEEPCVRAGINDPTVSPGQVITLPPQPVRPRPILAQPCTATADVTSFANQLSTVAAEAVAVQTRTEQALDQALTELIRIAQDLDPQWPTLYLTRTGTGPTETIAAHPHVLGLLRDAAQRSGPGRGLSGVLGSFPCFLLCGDDTIPPGQIQLRPQHQPPAEATP
jgi:hypothetical protein